MNIVENVSLAEYSTMGLGGNARYLTEVSNRQEVIEAVAWAGERQLPIVMIGGGSNIIWSDSGFQGLVVINQIAGYQVFEEDETNAYLTIGAGENWDSVVNRSVQAGLTGIEALSLIPGSAGATPIQNVGAYGQEISETLTTVEAYDTQTGQFVTIPGNDCSFSYRNSRFKTGPDRGRYFITGLTLHLVRGTPEPPFYASVQTYFDEHGIKDYTPTVLRQAVMDIRTAKLPDPATVHNTGSFFGNPIVDLSQFESLRGSFDALPNWPVAQGYKLSAAWLIEQAGFKDYHDDETGMATWPRQSLVLVNEHARTTADLLKFKQKVVDAVQAKFGITLVQEPEMMP